jgi:hypothetical protein
LARYWTKVAVFAAVLATAVPAVAVEVAVTGRDADYAARFAGALSEMLDGRITMVPPAQARLRVALDAESFREALTTDDFVIGVDIPRAQALRARQQGCRCTALFAGPDPRRQVRLIRELLPAAGRVGLLLGPGTRWMEDYLSADIVSPPVRYEVRHMDDPGNLGPVLTRLLPRVDVLLAVQDPDLFNASTAKMVLLTSYRQRKPVVGPGAEFVRAGSLATTYSSGYDLVTTVGTLLDGFASDGDLPPPAFPADFSVTVNEHVARAYDLVVRDPQWLVSRLRRESDP